EYFYVNLSRMTSGSFLSIREEGSMNSLLANVFDELSGLMTSFDLHTTLENGFCFGRFTEGLTRGVANVSRPILQVGRYRGSFPFILEASGVLEDDAFSYEVEISESEVHAADSLNETIWVGKYIDHLESESQTNDVVSEIISYSMRQRVLSQYTAFIALEPSDTVSVCLDCEDESALVTTEDELPADSTAAIDAFPNPFTDLVTIDVRLPVASAAVKAEIFDMMGRRLRTFSVPATGKGARFTWNGKTDSGQDVSSGVYFVTVAGQGYRLSRRIVRIR
ncbi:MAG: FlgD immunoglobulin-like domain containing protein, partial [Rhodothermales bacterium]